MSAAPPTAPIRPLALDDLDIAEMERRIELVPLGATAWCSADCANNCSLCTAYAEAP